MKTKLSFVRGVLSSICLISLNLFSDNTAQQTQPPYTENRTPLARYSEKVIDRPGVIPVGIINFDTDISLRELKSTNLSIASQFGIVEKLQGEISYNGAYVSKSRNQPTSNIVTLSTKYNYLSLPHSSFSALIKLPMHVMSNDEILRNVTVGLPVVFYNDIMAGSILGDIVNITMRPNVAVGFDFPFWYGVQVYGNLWAMIHSSLGSVNMVNTNNQAKWGSVPFWQVWPATLALTYVVNHYFDVGATYGHSNLLKAGDTIKFGLNFSIRGGRIFG